MNKLVPKHLYGHIFYQNTRDNFGYDYEGFFNHKGQGVEPPEQHEATVPFKTIDELRATFENKPLFIIGSGPSLNKNLHRFAELYSDELGAVTVACDGSVHDLTEIGFKPDFVASCEADGQHNRPQIPTTDLLLEGRNLDQYDSVPLIACTWLNKRFRELYPCKETFWYVNFDRRHEYDRFWLHHKEIFPTGVEWPALEPRTSTVGFHCIDLGRYLGSSEVILLGFDFCVTDKHNHHSKHFNISWEDTNTDLTRCYAEHLNRFLTQYNGQFGVKVVNCTEGGALNEENTDCTVMTIEEKIKQMREG